MQLVRVVWVDIQSCDEPWIDLKEAKAMKPIEMTTVGYMLEESKDHVVVVSTVCSDKESVGSVNAIPRGVIRCVTPLRLDAQDCGETPCCSTTPVLS